MSPRVTDGVRTTTSMRIGINVSWMSPGQAGGMEWYVRNLLKELQVLDQRHHYVIVTSPQNWHIFDCHSPRWKKIAYGGTENAPDSFAALSGVPPDQRDWRRRLYDWLSNPRLRRWKHGLNDLIRHERLDLWFCPLIYMLPLDTEVPVVHTIPDLQHEYFPEFFSARELAFRTMGYQYSCKRAAATIGISGFVAGDLVVRYGLEPHRTFGIPLALDPSYVVTPELRARLIDEVRLKYYLDYDFIYYPANGWRHKNHEMLVEALKIVRAKGRDVRLVLTGCEFDVMERITPLFASPEEAGTVRHLGYVSRRDTIGLYAATTLMVFPSLFEGFGLPLLEAMQLGAPVVCLPVASVPEVGGDAVEYADPPDAGGVAEAVLRLLDDDHRRQRLVAAGTARVREFSFADTARRTLTVFDAVLSGTLRSADFPPFRPLIAHNWLRDGHSRWYFHCDTLRAIRLTVVQPTRLVELADQRMTVLLNGQTVLEAVIEREQRYTFTVIAPLPTTADFHRLDVQASATVRLHGEVLSLQVCTLTIAREDGTELSLIA
jgi:glycosyltransferase involved in cell wall biosynthesis